MVKSLSFKRIGGATYPQTEYDGQEDQSYGFFDAFKLQTGNTRGTQEVGYGGTKIDGANNRITVGDSVILDGENDVITVQDNSGAVSGVGKIPGTDDFGFFAADASGRLVFKYVTSQGTWYDYNPATGINYMQHGVLPDGSGGFAVAASGQNVSAGF